MDLALDLPKKKQPIIILKNKIIDTQPQLKQKKKESKFKIEEVYPAPIENENSNKFLVIDSKELIELNFPNFDKENNDLYEPIIDTALKKSTSKVGILSKLILNFF